MLEAQRLSLIVPVLNEEATIATFLEESGRALDGALALMPDGSEAEWVFVNDGSDDATEVVITRPRRRRDPRIKTGQSQPETSARRRRWRRGWTMPPGDAVIPIDVDLQDPPEVIVEMVRAWLDGAQVVNARRGRSLDRQLVQTSLVLIVLQVLQPHCRSADSGERRRLPPVGQAGGRGDQAPARAVALQQGAVQLGRVQRGDDRLRTRPPDRPARRNGAPGSFGTWRSTASPASTTVPLRIWTYVGAAIAALAFLYALFLIVYTMIFGADAPGFASIMVAVLGLGGLQLLSLGIMGEYVGRIARPKSVAGRSMWSHQRWVSDGRNVMDRAIYQAMAAEEDFPLVVRRARRQVLAGLIERRARPPGRRAGLGHGLWQPAATCRCCRQFSVRSRDRVRCRCARDRGVPRPSAR